MSNRSKGLEKLRMADSAWENKLHFGDDVDILLGYVASGNVDVIHLNLPFDSNATHHVCLQEKSKEKSATHTNNAYFQESMLLTRYSRRLEGPRHG